jgi:hypothetical protein
MVFPLKTPARWRPVREADIFLTFRAKRFPFPGAGRQKYFHRLNRPLSPVSIFSHSRRMTSMAFEKVFTSPVGGAPQQPA